MSRPSRILLIKLGAIGDVCMLLPAVEQYKHQNPNIHLTWICGSQVAPLITSTGLVDRLIVIDDAAFYGKKGLLPRIRATLKLIVATALRPYSQVFVAYRDPRYRALLALTLSLRWHTLRPCTKNRPLIPGRYHTIEYHRWLTQTDSSITKDLPAASLQQLPAPPPGLPTPTAGKKRIALAPGGASNLVRDEALRRWPIDSYVQLARLLHAQGHTLILTGAPSDQWVEPHFAGIPFTSCIGKTSLTQLIALYRVCDLVITHDSGPLHLACLAGTRALSIFGPTDPYEKLPRSRIADTFWGGKHLPCRPCYDGRSYAECNTQACMREITPETVAEHLNQNFFNRNT